MQVRRLCADPPRKAWSRERAAPARNHPRPAAHGSCPGRLPARRDLQRGGDPTLRGNALLADRAPALRPTPLDVCGASGCRRGGPVGCRSGGRAVGQTGGRAIGRSDGLLAARSGELSGSHVGGRSAVGGHAVMLAGGRSALSVHVWLGVSGGPTKFDPSHIDCGDPMGDFGPVCSGDLIC